MKYTDFFTNLKESSAPMKTWKIRVYEVEHDGDTDNYVDRIYKMGGKNIQCMEFDEDEESAVMKFDHSITDPTEIRKKLDAAGVIC